MRKIPHVKSCSKVWRFLSLLIHPLSWHSHRLHPHLHRPGNRCHCPLPAVHSMSPQPLSSTCHYHQAAPPLCRANMAWSLRLLPRESGIRFTAIKSHIKSHIFGITLMYKHIILPEKNMLSLTTAWPSTVFAILFEPLSLLLSTEQQHIFVSG